MILIRRDSIRGSPDEGTFIGDSSIYSFFSEDKIRGSYTVTSIPTSSQVAGSLTLPTCLTPKMWVASLNRESARDYVKRLIRNPISETPTMSISRII